jgi:hypothetical protein
MTRKQHLAGLLGIYPTLLEQTLCDSMGTGILRPFVQAMADVFPPSSLVELDNSLRTLFERIFRRMDENAAGFADL